MKRLTMVILMTLFPLTCYAQSWQQTLEAEFDIVETFDQLQDWKGGAINGEATTNLPTTIGGGDSIWNFYTYWSGSPSPNDWITNHGSSYVWQGTKSLRMEVDQGGDGSAKTGPSRFGTYFGTDTADGVDPYSSSGIVTSGYRGDVYLFYMVKFHNNAFPGSFGNYEYFNYYKFNVLSLGFTAVSSPQEGSNTYGAANIHTNITTGASYNNHLRHKLQWYCEAGWPGVEHTTWVSGSDGADLDTYVDQEKWSGIEIHVHRGAAGSSDGYQEYWIYDEQGNANYGGITPSQMYVPSDRDWGFNKFFFGGNLSFDTTGLDSSYYVDDFIMDEQRIGTKYFQLLSGSPSPTPNPQPPVFLRIKEIN